MSSFFGGGSIVVDEQQDYGDDNDYGAVSSSSSSSSSSDVMATDSHDIESRTLAASITTGIFGLLHGGPITAIIASFSTMIASARNDVFGDIVNAIGDVAIYSKHKFYELDKKHHVISQLNTICNIVIAKIKVLDEKYGLLDRVKEATYTTMKTSYEYMKKHHLIERAVVTATTSMSYVLQTFDEMRTITTAAADTTSSNVEEEDDEDSHDKRD